MSLSMDTDGRPSNTLKMNNLFDQKFSLYIIKNINVIPEYTITMY